MERTAKHKKSKRVDLSGVRRQLDKAGNSSLDDEIGRLNQKNINLKKWGESGRTQLQAETELRKDTEAQLQVAKKEIEATREENTGLSQELESEKEKNAELVRRAETAERELQSVNQQLQSANATLENNEYVCNSVQMLEGCFLHLNSVLDNGIKKVLIENEVQKLTSRSSLSLKEKANLAMVHIDNPTEVTDRNITRAFLSYVLTFAERYHALSVARTAVVHPAKLLNGNPDFRSEMFHYLMTNFFGPNLDEQDGLPEFVQMLNTKSISNVQYRSSQQRQQQQRLLQSQSRVRPRESAPPLVDSPHNVESRSNKRQRTSL